MNNRLNKNDFQAAKQQVGKEVLKTLAAVFIGLPLFCLFIAWLLIY